MAGTSSSSSGDGEDEGSSGGFKQVTGLDVWESAVLHVDGDQHEEDQQRLQGEAGKKAQAGPVVKITGMPGKHVPPGPLSVANDILKAVPPTNGWLLQLGYEEAADSSSGGGGDGQEIKTGYRIYISGDTLFVDDLKEIPKHFNEQRLDLMLVHLGGTTIPGPSMPLLMVTMDAEQGFKLMQLMDPDVTIPIHFDDYDVFLSPLSDFKDKVETEGWGDRVVYLDRGEMYRFKVRK
ncbi:uncharacterized protein B0I36DRAFT_321855 [Microdochium trichocladiopsis]|uniref:Metallo-beta-lactamase domain-containing protein n=1 Tax=Microdochium trichocladiopsis TaxID=1682393 RepID=A0A9P8Y9P9_9PEZI|nr:uncharacterized protein B0I36DRAFT_321855 [Microdochium trichocladiopsis]KAH7033662.1 hypothetical protein B0I36DRAFT_321855 [Microdochium trichocladiopsis]